MLLSPLITFSSITKAILYVSLLSKEGLDCWGKEMTDIHKTSHLVHLFTESLS